MKQTVTKNARAMLKLLAKEIRLQQDRVAGGHITDVDAERYLIERLVAIGKRNKSVQAFLTYVGPIDKDDDESSDRDWAKDPREGRRHVVQKGTCEPEPMEPGDWDNDRAWPEPGERIA